MENTQCLEGCSGELGSISNSSYDSYNDRVTVERKISGPDSTLPPLSGPIAVQPSFLTQGREAPIPREQLGEGSHHQGYLKEGCYYMRLMPTSLHTSSRFQYEGTLRIQRTEGTIIASGDLYKKDFCQSPPFCPSLSGNGDIKNSIPVFPRKHYAYYLRVTRLQADPESRKGIVLEFESHRFEHSHQTWAPGEPLTTELTFSTGPDGIHYWRGDIQTRSNVVMGQILMVRVSPYLRQAVIEIDRVAASECPKDEEGRKWESVFQKAGWHVTIDISDEDVEEPEDHSWSTAELHKKMLKYRQSNDLDRQWRYHLLAVRELDDKGIFGLMYDNTIKGVNDIPREGAAIASHVEFPHHDFWGECKGGRFGTFEGPYLRTAIHEIGHAMMLYHPDNPYENYIMQKTVNIAHNVTPPQHFPGNIEWSFSPRDIHLLCHLPDIAIRPGGVSFGTPHDRLPVNVRDEIMEAEGLELKVSPLKEVVPIGAPVRVNYSLINRSNQDLMVPGSLRMKGGHVSGRVIDPSGAAQDFATILHYTVDAMSQTLPPGGCLSHSMTLLWGTEGPLFPTSGYYRIILELNWSLEGIQVRISGNTSVMVTPPQDEEHARAALKIFSTPDTLMALAVGGDHIEAGNEIIRNAISSKVLKPHFNLIEAKRLGQRFLDRKPKLKEASQLMDEETVMTGAEVLRMAKVLRGVAKETEKKVVEKMSKLLLEKAKGTTVEEKVEGMINEIQDQFVK
jgi:hypothetical protein